MEFALDSGLSYTNVKTVQEKMLASRFGSGDLKVLSTPVMIGFIEEAALKAVDDKLPEGYKTVGYNVDINHLAPTPLGMEVRAEARLNKIEDRKLFFEVQVYDEKEKVGEGNHIRYIVNKEKLEKRAESKID